MKSTKHVPSVSYELVYLFSVLTIAVGRPGICLSGFQPFCKGKFPDDSVSWRDVKFLTACRKNSLIGAALKKISAHGLAATRTNLLGNSIRRPHGMTVAQTLRKRKRHPRNRKGGNHARKKTNRYDAGRIDRSGNRWSNADCRKQSEC